MINREYVYQVIDGERAYQDTRWNADTTPTEGRHSVTEWLVYLDYYIGLAKAAVTTQSDPKASEDALHIVRKIAGMSVACMEQQGALPRPGYEPKDLNSARGGMKS